MAAPMIAYLPHMYYCLGDKVTIKKLNYSALGKPCLSCELLYFYCIFSVFIVFTAFIAFSGFNTLSGFIIFATSQKLSVSQSLGSLHEFIEKLDSLFLLGCSLLAAP